MWRTEALSCRSAQCEILPGRIFYVEAWSPELTMLSGVVPPYAWHDSQFVTIFICILCIQTISRFVRISKEVALFALYRIGQLNTLTIGVVVYRRSYAQVVVMSHVSLKHQLRISVLLVDIIHGFLKQVFGIMY